MLVNLFIENQVYKGLSLGISDCKLALEISRDLNIGVGDEFDFTYHNELCEDGDIETNPASPKYLKSIECYDSEGNKMDSVEAWKKVLYEKYILVTRRIICPDGKIELRGKLV